jgi:hypothetical protein
MSKITSKLINFTPFKRVTFFGVIRKSFFQKHIRINNVKGIEDYIEQLNNGETVKIILERIE